MHCKSLFWTHKFTCLVRLQSFSTTEDDSLPAVAARESDEDTVSRSSEGSGSGLHYAGQVEEAGDPPPAVASTWLKPAVAQPSVRGAPVGQGRVGEERPESTLSQPFGDYSKDSLEGVCSVVCVATTGLRVIGMPTSPLLVHLAVPVHVGFMEVSHFNALQKPLEGTALEKTLCKNWQRRSAFLQPWRQGGGVPWTTLPSTTS